MHCEICGSRFKPENNEGVVCPGCMKEAVEQYYIKKARIERQHKLESIEEAGESN